MELNFQKNMKIFMNLDPNIPYDIQILINKKETGLALLRLVEIIGEDKFTRYRILKHYILL